MEKQTKKVTRKKVTPKPKEAQVQEAQEAKAVKKVIQETIIHRDLIYLYPEWCTDTLARKAFRQKARNEIRKLERKLRRMEKANEVKGRKALIAEIKEERERVLADPTMEV
jgi:hypothetical protein